MTNWMRVYINMNILRSTDPAVSQVLDEIKPKLAEANEYVMKFFDLLGVEPEAEG